jgi:hypothetical protein
VPPEGSDALDRAEFVQTVDQLYGVLNARRDATRGDLFLIYTLWFGLMDDSGIEGLDSEEEALIYGLYNTLDDWEDGSMSGDEALREMRTDAATLRQHLLDRSGAVGS